MSKIGIYAGSFDPATEGHLWMIKEAAKLVDTLIVAVGINPEKKYTFSEEERINLLQSLIKDMGENVIIKTMGNEFLVDFAKRHNAQYIIRGIRSGKDYEYERTLQRFNLDQAPEIQTILLMTPRELEDVSSSFVKSLVGVKGWITKVKNFVPVQVYNALKRKYLEQRWVSLHKRLNLNYPAHELLFTEIIDAYSEDKRAYHNINHLIYIFEVLDQYRHLAEEPDLIEYALWFHDIEDDRTSKKPIKDAIKRAVGPLYYSEEYDEIRHKIVMLIQATSHDPKHKPKTNDEKLINDIDMAVLAGTDEEYEAYCQAIQVEYKDVPAKIFCDKRIEILNNIIDTGVYLHEILIQEWQEKSINNMKQEINKLYEAKNYLFQNNYF